MNNWIILLIILNQILNIISIWLLIIISNKDTNIINNEYYDIDKHISNIIQFKTINLNINILDSNIKQLDKYICNV